MTRYPYISAVSITADHKSKIIKCREHGDCKVIEDTLLGHDTTFNIIKYESEL